MKRYACFLLLAVALGGLSGAGQKKPYSNRWVRISSNLRDDAEVERVRKIVETAAAHGLTGVALSAGLDSLDLKTEDYFRRLKAVRELCARYNIEIIPSFFSPGYGGAILAHDKNLAAGLPVKDAPFVVSAGRARLTADPLVQISNGSFEKQEADAIVGFSLVGRPGDVVSVDTQIAKEGGASLRFENFNRHPQENARISQKVGVAPYRCYRLSAWVKAEGMGQADPFGSGSFLLEVLGGQEKRPLQYQNPRLAPSGEWQRVAVGFNSWGYNTVEIAPRIRSKSGGKFWVDDLRLEEVGLVNALRRPGTPLVVRSDTKGTVYDEGRDYAPVSDPQLNFRYDHEGPTIEILPSSRIQEGDRLRVSYYHGTTIYNGQTPVCMSEPKVYEIWRDQAQRVHEALAPAKYLINLDEVRTGGSCEACRRRGLTLGQILGDCLTKQYEMLRKANPKAEVFVWSDMLDPNHNANPDKKYYYLAEGNYAGSWNHVPKDLIILCWYFEKRAASLRHFSSLGFRTMAGAYYDGDNLDNIRGWLEALDATPAASGILYTTWLNKYDLLPAFGELAKGQGSGQ
ncbi:MAG: hypothetical protein ACR2L2_09620 [Acidobacteriota bacterium]